MSIDLETSARKGRLIVMAGAGVSAGKPSSLPGWKPMNAAIVQVLCDRLESGLERKDWISKLLPLIDTERSADRFPPDYQAQLIEEMCGERYFKALQALDVDVINSSHDSIAALAASGAVRAVVTTNFDRLIEHAFDKRSLAYVVSYDDPGYKEMYKCLITKKPGPIPIIKIHGCVTNHLSMIDTLKQRKRGRTKYLQKCLSALYSDYWLYLGFSAADLETERNYLGLANGAKKSAGATYVAFPGSGSSGSSSRIIDENERKDLLGSGAQILIDAYGDKGQVVVAYIDAISRELCQSLGKSGPDPIPDIEALGLAEFKKNLAIWADGLSLSAAGLCLAALLEAIGQGEPAVRILDRLVRKELFNERDTPDFRSLQLNYGRLGGAWGRFIAVPDINGMASNASVEAVQSLARILDSSLGFAAASWFWSSLLWLDDGQQATALAIRFYKQFLEDRYDGAQPNNLEEIVDAWLSASQICILNSGEVTLNLVHGTAKKALDYAKQTGDVVRVARVAAVDSLSLAETNEDLPFLIKSHSIDFKGAERVGDGFSRGMRALALGRWYVGSGGLAFAQIKGSDEVAGRALAYFDEAIRYFRNQGMDPWELFVFVQAAKAYADLHNFDEVQRLLNDAELGLVRFPVLSSHVYEATGQIQAMVGDENSAISFQNALEAAKESGLIARIDTLKRYLSPVS